MCLDNIEEIGAAVEAAKKAKVESEAWESAAHGPNWDGMSTMALTSSEVRLIHARRIEQAEQALKDLGFRGPLAKAAPADAADTARVMNARMP